MTTKWEDIDVPRGAYLSWGTAKGQNVTGKVLDYSLDGGTDFGGNRCPSLAIELTEPAVSISKDGVSTDIPEGELVQLNAGQVSLKRALRAADPSAGDLLQITLENLVKTPNGTVKEFGIRIARRGGASSALADDEPPF